MPRTGHKPKKLTEQQITGPLAVNLVERALLSMGFPWHPTRQELEGGIDGFAEIRDPATGRLTNSFFKVQVRGTTRLWAHETKDEFSFRCSDRDIDYWMSGDKSPVVLVVVRPEGDEAYWADIREEFAVGQRRAEHYVRFNKHAQRFDRSAMRALMRLAIPKDAGTFLPAVFSNEMLFTNLLQLKSYPEHICIAPTEYYLPKDLIERARAQNTWLPGGWFLHDKTIRCFHDLREGVWTSFCERGAVETFDTTEWSHSDDPQRQYEFVRLLNHAFRADMRLRRMWWSPDDKCFFFPPEFRKNQPTRRDYKYRSLQQMTTSEVVMIQRLATTKDVFYWRHDAFIPGFERCDDKWYLAITPHYVFTTDGRTAHSRGYEFLSGLKRLEHQKAVFGQVLMWKHLLTQDAPLFEGTRRVHAGPSIGFGDLLTASCARGIIDSDWLPIGANDSATLNQANGDSAQTTDSEALFK